MEVFSTLPRALVPWTTNVLTLGVLVSATWWSAGQRPLADPANGFKSVAIADSRLAVQQSNERAKPVALPAAPADGSARWQLGTSVTSAQVQAVGYVSAPKP